MLHSGERASEGAGEKRLRFSDCSGERAEFITVIDPLCVFMSQSKGSDLI